MYRVPCRYCSKKVPYKHRAEHERLHGAKPKMRGRPTKDAKKTKHTGKTTGVETSKFYHKELIVEDPEAAPPTASTVFDPRAVVEACAPSSQACSIALNTTIANWFPKFHTLEDRNKSLCGRDWTNCRRVRAHFVRAQLETPPQRVDQYVDQSLHRLRSGRMWISLGILS